MLHHSAGVELIEGCEPGHVGLYVHKKVLERESELPIVDYDLLTKLYDDKGLRDAVHEVWATDERLSHYDDMLRVQEVATHTRRPFMQEAFRGAVKLELQTIPLNSFQIEQRHEERLTYATLGAALVASVIASSPALGAGTMLTGIGYSSWFNLQAMKQEHAEIKVQEKVLLPRYAQAVVFASDSKTAAKAA